MSSHPDSFGSRSTLSVGDRRLEIFRLDAVKSGDVSTLPFSLKVLLENLLRNEDGRSVTKEDVEALAGWDPKADPSHEIAFTPARVLLQDFTGVPAVVDLAAMRDAYARLGGDAAKMNPLLPADLVIDHSVQVDHFGTADAFRLNAELEMERNRERYQLLRWGQEAFDGFRAVPPDTGIVHQVNLEYLAHAVFVRKNADGTETAYPDSLVGTDSHTTMINGLGVLGWGVGGIEAEAGMLGQPVSMLIPQVVGFKLEGELPEGATATDLVLRVVQDLRARGVVGKFVEFYGPGLDALSLPDRATLANMAPEYGATMGFFPIDAETIDFLRFTGRDEAQVAAVEAYCRENQLFRTAESPEPRFTDSLTLDMAEVVPSLAGPKRPQDRAALTEMKRTWRRSLVKLAGDNPEGDTAAIEAWADDPTIAPSAALGTLGKKVPVSMGGGYEIAHGAVTIAAITSCTNTSNPSVMLAAGLVAKKAREKGLTVKPWVKTSLAPGSKVVMEYLERAELVDDLEALGFHLVGYGCTTCIGNSGPLPPDVSEAVKEGDLVVCSVLSGNRNFEGRISAQIKANWLASPPLVVAYALAGTTDWDPQTEPLGTGADGQDVFLKDVWPAQQEIRDTQRHAVTREQFEEVYATILEGTEQWRNLEVPEGRTFAWDPDSTYIREPPFFEGMTLDEPGPPADIEGARVLALLGDSVTTDHISPAGSFPADGPAGRYLLERGVEQADFNSFGSRRGNHEVMMRGTFANIRLRNLLAPGTEGGFTRHLPGGEVTSIFEASEKYRADGTPLVVIAGKEYGTGSSRDWAAKGTRLLGVSAVITQSFERIHRSNLIGMGVLPLQFKDGEGAEALGLTGEETFDVKGLASLEPRGEVEVVATADDGRTTSFQARCRIDTPQELDYWRHGGILLYVLRQSAKG
jgi:aconitate hydratase